MKTQHQGNSFQRFLIEKKEQLSLTGVSVFVDWALILIVVSVLFIGLLAWSWKINEEVLATSSLQDTSGVVMRSRVDIALLERITAQVQSKQERFSALSNGFVFSDRAPVVAPLIKEAVEATSTATTTPVQ